MAVVVAASGSAAAQQCDQDGLPLYLQHRFGQPTCRPGTTPAPWPEWVLALDHERQQWSLYRSECDAASRATLVGAAKELRVEISGVPSFARRRDEKVVVLVSRTNPLLYSATSLPGEQRETPDLAGLRTFATLATTTISAGLQVSGQRSLRERQGEAQPEFVAPGPEELIAALAHYAAARIEGLRAEMARLRVPIETLDSRIDGIQAEKTHAAYLVQLVEVGVKPAAGEWLSARAALNGLMPATHRDIAALEAALLAAHDAPCGAAYGQARQAAALLLDPIDSTDLTAANARFRRLVNALRDLGPAACPFLTSTEHADEREVLRAVGEWLGQWSPESPPVGANHDALATIHDWVTAYVTLAGSYGEARELGAKLLGQSSAVTKTAAALLALQSREADRHAKAVVDQCGFGVFEVPDWPDPFDWDKVNVHKFKIAADAPVAPDVFRRRPDVADGRFELFPRRWFDLSVGFGVVAWTQVEDYSYAPRTIPGEGTQLFIGRASEDAQAGKLGLFLTVEPRGRLREFWRPGFDLGFATDTDHPGFFVGVSMSPIRYVRIGGGVSWQEVTRLALDQVEVPLEGAIDAARLTRVTSAQEIRTRDIFAGGFKRGRYASIVLTIPSLPFFKPKE